MNNNILPENWLNVHLGSIIDYGKSDKAQPHEICDDTWVLELEDIEKNSSKILKKKYFLERQSKSTKNKFNKGDVLYGKLRPYLNKVVIADESGVCTTEIVPIKCNELLNNEFIFFWLKSPFFLTYVTRVGHGVNMPRLGTEDGKKAPFVLPPLAEQKEIARLLQQYLAKVEQTKSHLKAIPKLLTTFRQSVLADAVSGKLCNNDNNNSGTLNDVCDFQNGFAFKSSWFTKEGDYQAIKLANIRDQYLAVENSPAYLPEKISKEYLRFCAEKDDILISMTGTRFKRDYGFSCLVPESNKFLINQRVGRLIINTNKMESKYLLLILSSHGFRDKFFAGETGGVNQGNVGSTHIKKIGIEFPSLDTQKEVVLKSSILFTFADNIERQVQSATEHVNLLTQSILAKAFSGELTADWRKQNLELISGDNSAEALLARIQAQMKGSKAKTKAIS